MTQDERIARATSITVGFVALFAAIVSYLHIRSLALDHGYDVFTAYLAPFGVDGLIVGASLMLLIAYRARLRAPVARFALWLGIGGTLAANVAYGLPHGVVGAISTAWPAASFIVIVEAWIQLQKRKRKSKPQDLLRPRGGSVPRLPRQSQKLGYLPRNLCLTTYPRQTVRVLLRPTRFVRKLGAIRPRRQSWPRS